MSLTIFNDDEFQALEHRAANQLGEATLMERAGAAAAALIESRLPSDAKVSILAGPGNNGGDAIALACELKEKNRDVVLILSAGRRPTTALALAQLERWNALGGESKPTPTWHAKLTVWWMVFSELASKNRSRATILMPCFGSTNAKLSRFRLMCPLG